MKLKLLQHQVEKPWGRKDIRNIFGAPNDRRIGEIWFEAPGCTDLPLLLKYIFTSEKLSVQVHPDDTQARSRGLASGKTECWYILEADQNATLGLGLRKPVSKSELREAAIGGFLEQLVDWKPVKAGDFFYVPPGTIHAIGAGITLLEFQQNADVTYRLYDYGRPRELHLDDALAVSNPCPYSVDHPNPSTGTDDMVLVNGPIFNLMRVSSNAELLQSVVNRRRWVTPLQGSVTAGEDSASAGECLLVDAQVELCLNSSAVVLCGSEGTI